MKSLLILGVLLCVALCVRSAAIETLEATEENIQPYVSVEAENEVELELALPQEDETAVIEEQQETGPKARFFVCPSGWTKHRGSCYLYVSSGRSWSSAAAHCASLGASLPSVHNVFDYTFLQKLAQRSGSNTVAWIGGLYFQGWRWVDQSRFDYSNWSSQNTVSKYQCMHLHTRAGWSNNNCANGWPSICMRSSDSC